MAHFVTNRGKLILSQGGWDSLGASVLKVGLLTAAAIPTAIDTQAEANPLNFVSNLLALSGVTEVTGGWYSRQALSRTSATEDDTNNRANLDAGNITWAAATAGVQIWGGFVFKDNGSDATNDILSVFSFASVVTTDGNNLVLNINDLYRIS